MKKLTLFITSFALTFSLNFSLEAKAESTTNEITTDQKNEVDFSDLPENVKEHFYSDGFSENDDFYQTTIIQPADANSVAKNQRLVNVLVLHAATRKIINTLAYTSYTLVSSNSAMYKANFSVTYRGKRFNSNVNIPNRYDYNGGVYITYSGSKGYGSVRVTAQVYNGFGSGTVTSSAGGVTLGK
ncbi:hypothetical protein [Candidatus Enterococcus mansonii]|uniref:DUF5626 domain-containing protein n=1 Tax=Candidatus Enterococcus mansonii TaxID=1834181 RepID=A0A242CJP1_9ENTE|nr:hypothetical protein [Enterococcus sp. 4G2_DIV0659]OTO10002.1 hypothetical protein A5880_000685 [Enterococcus sp. 4G2_DIV0659]